MSGGVRGWRLEVGGGRVAVDQHTESHNCLLPTVHTTEDKNPHSTSRTVLLVLASVHNSFYRSLI